MNKFQIEILTLRFEIENQTSFCNTTYVLLFIGLRIQLSSYSPDDKCCHVNFCSCLLVSLQYCYACKSYNTPTPTTVTTEFPHSELESKISNKNILKLFAQVHCVTDYYAHLLFCCKPE